MNDEEREELEEAKRDDINSMRKRDIAFVQSILAQLSEHFPTVQVFCTRYISDEVGSVVVKMGAGDPFSRYGMVKNWIVQEEAVMSTIAATDTIREIESNEEEES